MVSVDFQNKICSWILENIYIVFTCCHVWKDPKWTLYADYTDFLNSICIGIIQNYSNHINRLHLCIPGYCLNPGLDFCVQLSHFRAAAKYKLPVEVPSCLFNESWVLCPDEDSWGQMVVSAPTTFFCLLIIGLCLELTSFSSIEKVDTHHSVNQFKRGAETNIYFS